MSKLTRQQMEAVKLFRGFRERDPERAKKIDLVVPDALMIVGHCEFIGYRSSHGNSPALYRHDFAKGSRPLLAAGPEVGQLFLIGDRFVFTDRGIVDLDADGNEIDDGGYRKRTR